MPLPPTSSKLLALVAVLARLSPSAAHPQSVVSLEASDELDAKLSRRIEAARTRCEVGEAEEVRARRERRSGLGSSRAQEVGKRVESVDKGALRAR